MNKSFIRAGLAATVAVALVLASASPSDASGRGKRVLIKDECDPATFNAVIPGVCQGNGDVTFSEFVAELTANRTIDEWAFDPVTLKVKAGRSVVVTNVGGEAHTFTRVARFGPGFVPFLNDLVFGPGAVPIPEFTPPFGAGINFVGPGGTLTLPNAATPLRLGDNLFECGIHPWMRMVITVKGGGDSNEDDD